MSTNNGTIETAVVNTANEVVRRGRKPKNANVVLNTELAAAKVELPEIAERKRGANPFGLSANRLLKVLNLPDKEKPSVNQEMTATMAVSLSDNPMFAAQFELFLTNLGVNRLQDMTTIGQNRHTVQTFGTQPVTEKEIVNRDEKVGYVANFLAKDNLEIAKSLAMYIVDWQDHLLNHSYDRISLLQKINRNAYRLHRITVNGIADEQGTPTTITLYCVEDDAMTSAELVKSAISHLVGFGKYVATNDDNTIGYGLRQLIVKDDNDPDDKNVEV